MPFGYCTSFFRYTRISPVQGPAHWVASPRGYGRPSLYPFRGFFPAFGLPLAGRLLLRPEGLYLLMRAVLRHRFPVGGFRLPSLHHCQEADLPGGYPRRIKLNFPCASKHWRALFIELIIRMVQIWNFQGTYGLGPEKYQMLPLGIPGSDYICGYAVYPKTLAQLPGFPLGHAIADSQRLCPETERPPPVLWEELSNFYIRHAGKICPDGVTEGIPGRSGIRLDPGISGVAVRTMHRGVVSNRENPPAGALGTSALHKSASFHSISDLVGVAGIEPA